VESILEIMIQYADPKAKKMLNSQPLCVINDMQQFSSGQTISYMQLCQGLISSKTIMQSIYEPTNSSQIQVAGAQAQLGQAPSSNTAANAKQAQQIPHFEQLKEIALE